MTQNELEIGAEYRAESDFTGEEMIVEAVSNREGGVSLVSGGESVTDIVTVIEKIEDEEDEEEEKETDDAEDADDDGEDEHDEDNETTEGGIHETREARIEKGLKTEIIDGEAHFRCRVCDELSPEKTVGSLGIGHYHVEHLSDEEHEYAKERQDNEEGSFDRMEFREVAERTEFFEA